LALSCHCTADSEAARLRRRYWMRASRAVASGYDSARDTQHCWCEGVVDWFEAAGLLVEVAEIVPHKGDEPNFLVELPDIELCPCKKDGDAAGGDEALAVLKGYWWSGRPR